METAPSSSTQRPSARAARDWLWLAAFVALFAIQVSSDWHSTPDTVRYLSIARHIAAGQGIADFDNPAPFLPPGYPLLISAPFAISERPFLAISLVHLLLAGILVAATDTWVKQSLGAGARLVTALVLVNASLWHHFRRPLSELAFTALAITAVALLQDMRTRPLGGARGALRAAAAFLLIAYLPLVREVGVVFALGFAAVSLADLASGRLPRATPAWLVVALVLAGLVSTSAFVAYDVCAARRAAAPAAIHLASLLEPPVPHGEWSADAIRFRIGEIGRLLVPLGLHQSPLQRWTDPRMIVFAPVALLVLRGWWRLFVRRDLLAVTAPLYVAVYVVWGFEAGTRYMLPLLPLLAAALWVSLEPLGRMRSVLFAALVGAHLLVSLYDWRAHDVPRARACAAEWPAVESLARALPAGAEVSSAAGVPECVWSMLELVLDRSVTSATVPWLDASAAPWRVVLASDPRAPGFETAAEAGSYRLLRRSEASAPDQPPAALR